MMLLPKPKKKKRTEQQRQKAREVELFKRQVRLLANFNQCQYPGCGHLITSAHHIKYRSQGGSNDPYHNGLGLCAEHDYRAHHGEGKDGDRRTAREFVLYILDFLIANSTEGRLRYTESRNELALTSEVQRKAK